MLSTAYTYHEQTFVTPDGTLIDCGEGSGSLTTADTYTDRMATDRKRNLDGQTFWDPSEGDDTSLKRKWRIDNGIGEETSDGCSQADYRRIVAVETVAELLGFRASGFVAEESKRRLLNVDDL